MNTGERIILRSGSTINQPCWIDPDERGGDSTIQILSVINTLTDAEGVNVVNDLIVRC